MLVSVLLFDSCVFVWLSCNVLFVRLSFVLCVFEHVVEYVVLVMDFFSTSQQIRINQSMIIDQSTQPNIYNIHNKSINTQYNTHNTLQTRKPRTDKLTQQKKTQILARNQRPQTSSRQTKQIAYTTYLVYHCLLSCHHLVRLVHYQLD